MSMTCLNLERFLAKIEVDDRGCWVWTGAKNSDGYGSIKVNGKQWLSHRLAYHTFVAPTDAILDHYVCDNPSCCNPEHLRPSTIDANSKRSPRHNIHKTHCPRGHALDGANIIWKPDGGRQCRMCHNEVNLRSYHRRKNDGRGEARVPEGDGDPPGEGVRGAGPDR